MLFLVFARKATYFAHLTGNPSILEIPVYVTLMVMGLSSFFGIFPLLDRQELSWRIPSAQYLVDGLILTGIGLLCFWIGYAYVFKIAKPSEQTEPDTASHFDFQNPSLKSTVILYGLLAALRIGLIVMGGGNRFLGRDVLSLGAWGQWLEYLLSANYLFLAIISMQHARGKWRSVWLALVLVVEILLALLSGWSSILIKLLVVVLGTQAMFRGRFSFRFLAAAVFVIVFSVPMIRSFRTLDVSSITSIVSGIQTVNTEFSDESRIGYTQDLLFERQIGASQIPAIIMANTPNPVAYRPIEELLLAPFAFVPRILWPDKPNYGGFGEYVADAYLGLVGHGSAAISPVGGFYMYGGYPVVMLGMLLIGCLSALYTRTVAVPALQMSQVSLLGLYIGATVRVFHLAEGSFVTVIPVMLQASLVYILLILVISIRGADSKYCEQIYQ